MAIPTTEEITERLAQLKQYSREFDRYRDCMRSMRSEQLNTAYKAMVEAEKQYNALSDWFVAQGIEICWDRGRQEYIVQSVLATWDINSGNPSFSTNRCPK